MKPTDTQIEIAEKAARILKNNMLVYIACEERVGKTIPAIITCERFKQIKQVLVLTKKKALEGWEETFKAFKTNKKYYVTNYHQAHKIKKDFDLIILDESHNYISSFPKKSSMWNSVRKLTKGKLIIYISATPFAQGYQLLYHQFKLSDWSPWYDYKNPYDWFYEFGIPDSIWIQGKEIKKYNKTIPETFDKVKHLFITKTRVEAGFTVEPESRIHYIELSDKTREVYNTITKDRVIILNDYKLVCDTIAKLRAVLHMLEGGVTIINTDIAKRVKKNYVVLGNTEKIDYIKDTFGDSLDSVIMYNYIAEGTKLRKHFKKSLILQATSFAEGVDLSTYKNLIIYSQDFSTARHTQRRARQANKDRIDPIVVHYLLVKDAISDQAYNAVAVNKVNYVDSLYNGVLLE